MRRVTCQLEWAAVETMRDDVKYMETGLNGKLDMPIVQFKNLTLTLNKTTVEPEKDSIMHLLPQKRKLL